MRYCLNRYEENKKNKRKTANKKEREKTERRRKRFGVRESVCVVTWKGFIWGRKYFAFALERTRITEPHGVRRRQNLLNKPNLFWSDSSLLSLCMSVCVISPVIRFGVSSTLPATCTHAVLTICTTERNDQRTSRRQRVCVAGSYKLVVHAHCAIRQKPMHQDNCRARRPLDSTTIQHNNKHVSATSQSVCVCVCVCYIFNARHSRCTCAAATRRSLHSSRTDGASLAAKP
jgi:hypothetical protein